MADGTLNELLAQLHSDAQRLAAHVDTPDLHSLADRLGQIGDTVGSLDEGRDPAPKPTANPRQTVLDLTNALHSDLSQLASRLHTLDPTDENWASIARELLGDSIQLRDLATGLKGAQSGNEPVGHVSAPKLNTAPLAGTTPGARPTSLDAAGRSFQSVLAAKNRQK